MNLYMDGHFEVITIVTAAICRSTRVLHRSQIKLKYLCMCTHRDMQIITAYRSNLFVTGCEVVPRQRGMRLENLIHNHEYLISCTCKIPVIPKCEAMCRCTHEIVHTDPCFLNPRNAIPKAH